MSRFYKRNGGRYTIEEIMPLLKGENGKNSARRRKKYMELDGVMVKTTSQRYSVFKKSLACCNCDLVGSFFAVEKYGDTDKYHFNLYAVDADGNEVLMTKDHIVPKSKGGKNTINNYQTMCVKCNSRKGNGDPKPVSKKKETKAELKRQYTLKWIANQLEKLEEKYGYKGAYPRQCYLPACKCNRLFVGEYGETPNSIVKNLVGVKCYACGMNLGINLDNDYFFVSDFDSRAEYKKVLLETAIKIWNGEVEPKDLKMAKRERAKERDLEQQEKAKKNVGFGE